MCHFHSVIVDGSGRIYHLPSNSHSGIAKHYVLDNLEATTPYWECEWDGIGAQPIDLCQTRHSLKPEPTAVAVSAVDRHYANLAKILSGESELHWSQVHPFNTADYSDVPARIEWAAAEITRRAECAKAEAKRKAEHEKAVKLGETLFDVFGEKLEALTDDHMVTALRAFVELSSVSMEEVAADEIESATEDMISTDSAYDYVLGDGEYINKDDIDDYVENSSDYYTQSQLNDAISEAKDEWMQEVIRAVENVG